MTRREPIPSPRQRLDEWGRILPSIWRAAEAERAAYMQDSQDWPSIVYLPLLRAGLAAMTAIHATGAEPPHCPGELSPAAVTTQGLAAWRMTQGIYRYDRTLYDALLATPVTGDIPADLLLRLPEWCVYIETPDMTVPISGGGAAPVSGLWYWLDCDAGRNIMLCIGVDLGLRPPLTVQHVPIVGTIDEAIEATLAEWQTALATGATSRMPPTGYREAVRRWLPQVLSLVLYLCSRAAEISGRGQERPGNPTPVATRRRGLRLYPADGPRQWDVGVRIGAALRRAMETAAHDPSGSGGRTVRPHVRGAHWHTYLTGPRRDVDPSLRQRELRWLPPIPVGIADYDDLIPTIRPVRE